MQFEYDIFISYCKKDNKPLDGSKGWIYHFQRYLEIRLTQLLKQKPKFLNYSNDEKPLASELAKACILIPVISPDYISDRESIEDIEVFFEETGKSRNMKIAGKDRVFKVVKFPVGFEYQPTKLKSYLSYDLYYQNPASGESQEINSFFGSDAEKTFWMRLDDLAHDIFDVLKEANIQRNIVSKKKSNIIYLAETGHDLTYERDLIKRELQRHGYKVLPDQALPKNFREMEAVIKKDLSQCRLSIHLIGDSYGDIPEGSEKSIIDIQNQLAAEYRSHAGVIPGTGNSIFNRLIWVSPNAKLTNEKQKLFIENLKRDAESINGAEVIQSSLEDLKNIIRKELSADNDVEVAEKAAEKNNALPSVYLIYDTPDMDGGKEIAKYFSEKGVEVYQPLFDGELLDVRNSHFENLRKCDAALIYYGKAREQWVQMKVLDVLKAPGLGRTKPIQAKAVLVEKGPVLNKDKFRSYDIAIIENNDGIAVSLDPLVAKIKK
jgi:hypothetical protein